MSKIKLLLDVVSDLRSLADSLQAVADAMTTQSEPAEAPADSTGKKTEKADTRKAAMEEAPSPAPEGKPLTLEEVRAVLAKKSRAGHTAEVKALLTKHGADKLENGHALRNGGRTKAYPHIAPAEEAGESYLENLIEEALKE